MSLIYRYFYSEEELMSADTLRALFDLELTLERSRNSDITAAVVAQALFHYHDSVTDDRPRVHGHE